LSDDFGFTLSFAKINEYLFKSDTIPAKREILKIGISIFDAFGILAEHS